MSLRQCQLCKSFSDERECPECSSETVELKTDMSKEPKVYFPVKSYKRVPSSDPRDLNKLDLFLDLEDSTRVEIPSGASVFVGEDRIASVKFYIPENKQLRIELEGDATRAAIDVRTVGCYSKDVRVTKLNNSVSTDLGGNIYFTYVGSRSETTSSGAVGRDTGGFSMQFDVDRSRNLSGTHPNRASNLSEAVPQGASKNDVVDRKPDMSLLPKVFLEQVAYVMGAGEKKYGRYNYTKGHKTSQLVAAAMRHLATYMAGEDVDQDTSDRMGVEITHLACVAANMLMLLHQRELNTLVDDRLGKSDE